MSTQLTAIHTEILETAGLASDDARFPSATLTRIVNRALRSLSAEHDWPWLDATETINTVAGTTSYSPAALWQKTKRLTYDNRDLVQFQASDAAQYANDTGEPQGFYIESDLIYFVPVPDGAYAVTHSYSSMETALSGDTDTPALPDRYIDWLVFRACIIVATRIRDGELYSMSEREVKAWARRAADEQRRSTRTQMIQARNDWTI